MKESDSRMTKPILCVDFDGVIHSYTSGWKGAEVISDPPHPGALEALRRYTEMFTVGVYSSRSHQPGGIAAMKDWLHTLAMLDTGHDRSWVDLLEWPDYKPSAMITIDDRALTFDGTWPEPDALLSFKPWNKSTWQDRLKVEQAQLVARLEKLWTMMSDPGRWDRLDPVDQELLRDQLDAMDRYRQALDLRIARISLEGT